MKGYIYNTTIGNPKKMLKPVCWAILANLVNFIPMGIMVYVVLTIYNYYAGTTEFNSKSLWLPWAFMFILFFILYILERKATHYTYHDGYDTAAQGRIKLAEHIRKLPLGYLMSKDPGELGNTMMNDFSLVEDAATHNLPQIISALITSVLMLLGMSIFDIRMALAMFAGLPVSIMILLTVQKLDEYRGKKHTEAKIEQSSRLQEYILGMKVMKAYNLKGTNFERLEKAFRTFMKECIKLEGFSGPFYLIAISFLQSGVSFITIAGVYLLLGGKITVTTFALFLLIGTRDFDPLISVFTQIAAFIYKARAGERIVSLLEVPEMKGEKDAPQGHDIVFENVTFGYGEDTVLHQVNAKFPVGSMTAVIGPSGSGKSTLLKLVARFYDPQEGIVRFGGTDEATIDPEQLMKKISVVFQDVYLFQDTVGNNIRYGREDATQEEIETAARLAHCHDFIAQMPNGYNTMIGEGGSTLSGGEKQRISIARAILKNAPVLLLDEATSSLDPENEVEIQTAIEELVKGRTVIIIAHKLKTIAGADQIVVMNHGEVEEIGTHDELIDKKGLYFKLWDIQQKTAGWKIG